MLDLAKRAWLYIPCSHPKKITKALTLRNVDAIIYDLEDSVPLNAKVYLCIKNRIMLDLFYEIRI
jgi:hypothetical protein